MPYALLVVALFLVVVLVLPKLVHANPSSIATGARKTLAGSVFAMSAFFALRGLLPIAITLFIAAVAIYGAQRGFGRTGKRSEGQKSTVKTSVLSMWLDHDTGHMDAEVLSGQFAGRHLSELALADLLIVLQDCVEANDQSSEIMMSYLNRMHPDWREGAGVSSKSSDRMSRAEALEILGLEDGATQEQVRKAYRTMMKKHHPDNGGSAWFAARINEANRTLTDKS